MKRLLLFFALTALGSCKKGGDDILPAFDPALVAGSWKLQALTIDPAETGVWGTNVTDLLTAYRNQISDDCINNFRMNTTADGKISRTTSDNCSSRTLTLFGFTEKGTWKASGSTLSVLSPYESGNYYNVSVDQTMMVWHRQYSTADSEDHKDHVVTLIWTRQ
ncbi:lipocalin family protein [Spirosoma luteum]|uniref:lipocalin family protein n=1 Tax=Spirosoma luteum TaxID=431553 RepID=UPI00035F2A66|nr:lipocalin family protein [Spirosoma luteum]